MTPEPFAGDLIGRRVRMDRLGDESVLYVDEAAAEPLGPRQVAVRVVATGINPGEAKIRSGALEAVFPSTLPQGQGSDLAGVVAAVSSDVSAQAPGGADPIGLVVGDEVLGWTDERRAQADYVVVPADQLIPKPAGLDWTRAGSLYVAGVTAWATVDAVGVRAGDTVVVAGASGGVGHLAVQLAVHAGARVLAVAGADSADWLAGYGAEPVTYGDGLADRLRGLAPDGIDAFIDAVGDGYVALAVDELDVATDRIDTIADFEAAAELGVQVRGASEVADQPAALAEVAGLIADGTVELRIASVHPLDDVRAAYAELAGGHVHGKIVLDVALP